jgi:hypothetical protein
MILKMSGYLLGTWEMPRRGYGNLFNVGKGDEFFLCCA